VRTFLLTLLASLTASCLLAHDYVPGPNQTQPVLLKGGDVYTVSDGIKTNTDILFDHGVITQIAAGIAAPPDALVIDVAGKRVYPGLIALGTNLGLIEIGAVRATNDISETGKINPDVQAHMAYNPDSEIIPTIRSNGVAYAQIVPGGSLICGRSCFLSLDSWTKEDAAVKLETGLHVIWPRIGQSAERRGEYSSRKPRVGSERELEVMTQAFDDAQAYRLAKAADPKTKVDSRWDAMLPVLAGELPLFVHASDVRQIEHAIEFCDARGIRMVLVGGDDAWKVIDLIKSRRIPVIYFNAHGMPQRQDEPYDQAFVVPRLLHDAGISLALAQSGASGVRNLAFEAGQAVAFGLPEDVALRTITLSPAEILGVADRIGSLEVGKQATMIVSDGDIMDHLTMQVTHMFIDGRLVDLDDKHKELYRKYRAKTAN
jgi:imidazolonepropionase-like amidohydrolase